MKIKPYLLLSFGLAAVLVGRADTLTWTGNGGDLQWGTAANWSTGTVPADGDVVEISNVADEIALAASTAELLRFSLTGATLSMTNWTTCLKADYVTIGDGGVLTCTATSDTNLVNDVYIVDGVYIYASRVWVDCIDLTIAEGGAIDVNKKGFANQTPDARKGYIAGLGPYPGVANFNHGAGHGGVASVVRTNQQPCGDLEEPVLPGSSGASSTSSAPKGGFGGGAVRIDATGTVTVNGSIVADAGEFLFNHARNSGTSGAGGSVLIHCNRFKGANGMVSARGGDYVLRIAPTVKKPNADNYPQSDTIAYNGAGGRIAIHYNAAAQDFGDVSGMQFDAASGSLIYEYGSSPLPKDADYARNNQAEAGTIYLTDSSFFEAQNGQGFAGQLYIPGFDSWSTPGDYTISTQMRFPAEGFQLNIGGNLVIQSPRGALQIGGSNVFLYCWPDPQEKDDPEYLRYDSGTTPWNLTVGGNMTLQGGTFFEAFPAAVPATEEANAYGAFVTVGGALTLESDSVLSSRCVPTNGAAVMYTAGSVDVQENALINAVDFGFESKGGPGGSQSRSQVGGGYGGFGSRYACVTNDRPPYAVTYHGWTYGDPIRPWQPGSGSYYSRHNPAVRGGGGAIRIRSKGRFILNGTIDASGPIIGGADTQTSGAPGSGGGIFLECSTFSGSGTMMANGGSVTQYHESRGAAGAFASGGGGRIAVYTGIPYNPEIMNPSCLTISEEAPETFTGTASVAGGTFTRKNTVFDPPDLYNGYPGTIRFVHCNVPATMILLK